MSQIIYAIYRANHQIDFFIEKNGIYHAVNLTDLTDDQHPLKIVIPGEWVVFHDLSIPNMSSAKRNKAIAYQLEDQLIHEIEQYHIVQFYQEKTNILVATIEKVLFEQILKNIPDKLVAIQIIPETLLLPVEDDKTTVLIDNDRILLREAKFAMSAQYDDLQELVRDKEIITMGVGQQNAIACLEQYFLSTLASTDEKINLLTGAYKPKYIVNNKNRYISVALLSIVSIFLLFVLTSIIETIYLAAKNHRLNTEIEANYYELFPSATSLVAPEARVKRLLGQGENDTDSVFLNLLYAISQTAKTHQQVTIENMRFENNAMTLTVNAQNANQIDDFTKDFTHAGMHAVEQSSTLFNGQLKSIIVLKR